MEMHTQTVARVSVADKKGNLKVWIPRKDVKDFKPGDHVVIAKIPSLEFKKASELID